MTTSVSEGAPRTRPVRLAGPSVALDPRIHAIRADLADAALVGAVTAPRYADPVAMQCRVTHAPLRAAPDDSAVVVSEILFGEPFGVFDLAAGWAWGQCGVDGYVGWARSDVLAVGGGSATHLVALPSATVFAAPDIKSRVTASLPLNARVAGTDGGDFVAAAGGYVHGRHLRAIGGPGADPVDLALGFVASPYVWGGRTRAGIDCSGLTQALLQAAGIACPRDADQQRDAFPRIAVDDRRRGDLVVFPGHVGLLVDAATIVHANAFWMATVVEPLSDLAARIAPTSFHRPH